MVDISSIIASIAANPIISVIAIIATIVSIIIAILTVRDNKIIKDRIETIINILNELEREKQISKEVRERLELEIKPIVFNPLGAWWRRKGKTGKKL